MNTKTLVPVVAIAIAGTLSAATSAEAFSVGSSYTISGEGMFSPTSISFVGDAEVTAATGDFSIMNPVTQGNFAIVALAETFDINVPGTGLLVNFEDDEFTFFGSTLLETKDTFDFTVQTAKFLSDSNRYRFTGLFGDGTPGIGEIAQLVEVSGGDGRFGYSGTFTAVPTPALLPGLIGMGVAALRQRRNKDEISA